MNKLMHLCRQLWVQQIVLLAACLLTLLNTVVPSLYSLDSAEFAIGASELGIVHAPGYPLYLILAHSFARVLGGDIDNRINLFSAINLALIAPILFALLTQMIGNRWAAACATLSFMWSYYVWSAGIVAEIYAPQMLTLAIVLSMLVLLYRQPATQPRLAIASGAAFGIAVAMHPGSILFAPGIVVAYRMLGIPLRTSLIAAGVAVTIFGISLIYFPLRYAADPPLNLAGTYNARGVFEPVNLQSWGGIWWLISGQQFTNMFFAEGILPSLGQIRAAISLFWGNYLGVGLIIGAGGAVVMYQRERVFFGIWAALLVPYTYFYMTYGVADLETMYGPTYLLWAVAIGYGMEWLLRNAIPVRLKPIIVIGLPALLLSINYPLLDLSEDRSVYTRAQHIMDAIPPEAVVFGHWWDIVPLQYLHIVEDQRSDLTLYNQFLYDQDTFDAYLVWHLTTRNQPVVLLGNAIPTLPTNLDVTMEQLIITISPSGQVTSEPIIAGLIFRRDKE